MCIRDRSCTTCLTHDCCFFEEAGIPAVGLLSSQFEAQAEYQAGQLGAENIDRVFVQHPISDQTTEQLHAKADAAMVQIVEGLLSNTTISKISTMAPPPSTEEEDCAA
eukprot:TRINITY_DN1277_c0_g1_i2.p2 TRINITY_DN1277_c0_g1~~TRINITY_DN1277_c0_g1_i2.p2  ORF type:complete len:108 (+),score=47.87 TRINITY_DN1277_c0_g1_i2:78-401(+)